MRGLKYAITSLAGKLDSRTPQGVRGLKSSRTYGRFGTGKCRTPQGVRGLKSRRVGAQEPSAGRTPQGVRGLK